MLRRLVAGWVCSLYFFEVLCDDEFFWTSLGTKLTIFYISSSMVLLSFITLVLESGVVISIVISLVFLNR